MTETPIPPPVSILILGAGWSSTFLLPLLKSLSISYAATTTDGRSSTIPFKFDPSSTSLDPYHALPCAQTVLITFPLKGSGPSRTLTSSYAKVHGPGARWIQLGSVGIYKGDGWNTSQSPYDTSDVRAQAEDELLAILPRESTVLDLAGLYGGQRDPRHWLTRVAKSKEALRKKGALHMVHGVDVARAVVSTHEKFEAVAGRRWIIGDGHCYDWWDMAIAWGEEASKGFEEENLEYGKWVWELMEEEGVRSLPRGTEKMGRLLDAREFWTAVGCWPAKPSILAAKV